MKYITRRMFIGGTGSVAAGLASGCLNLSATRSAGRFDAENYDVVILGDTHFDAEPAEKYHSHYEEKVEWLNRVQRAEFARNGEMWRERCPRLLKRAAANIDSMTAFTLQMGDLIQGDCGSAEVHRQMLDDVMNRFKNELGGLPFVTVVGNHDIRGKDAQGDYGTRAYAEYMPKRMSAELRKNISKTTFSFRRGRDVWIVIDFNHPDDEEIFKLFRESEDARYTFVVVHGPVFPYDGGNCRWYLHGWDKDPTARLKLRELFARRKVIVLDGHTHRIELMDWYGFGGRITQFTMNSVWTPTTPQPPKFDSIDASTYGLNRLKKNLDNGTAPKPEKELFGEIRPGIRRYLHADGAGSFKLHISDRGVSVDFFAGDSETVTNTWKLR